MADADGKMQMEKIADNKKSKKKKNQKCGWQKKDKQTEERNLSFKSLSHDRPFTYIQNAMPIVDRTRCQ